MSTSRGSRVEDTYEAQNDQRLDDLHTKVRTLRGITSDIHDDVERQNLMLDETHNRFASFGSSLTQTSDRLAKTFGIGQGGLKAFRVAMLVICLFITLWIVGKVWRFWSPAIVAGAA